MFQVISSMIVDSLKEKDLAHQLFEEAKREVGTFNYNKLCRVFGIKLRERGLDPRTWINYFQNKILSYV